MEIVHASDRALLVRVEGHSHVVSLARRLEDFSPHGVTSFSPSNDSVLIRYDPVTTDAQHLSEWLGSDVADLDGDMSIRRIVLPAVFDGPDLKELARSREMSTREAIRIFCATEYRVRFFGFVPGFAYMGDVDARIACPRRRTPRTSVPAGSIGIAGRQTGVYPMSTPGGWNLIGRCRSSLFDAARTPPCPLRVGDMVRFEPA